MKHNAKLAIDDTGMESFAGRVQGMAKEIETDQYIGSVVSWVHAQLAPRFDLYLDAKARSNPSSFHHVYEWPTSWGAYDTIGRPDSRLWSHYIMGNGRDKVAGFKFKASKRPVPVNPVLRQRGPSGKRVKIGFHVFVWKAAVMEFGTMVEIKPTLGDWLAFVPPGSNSKVFTQKSISMQGGTQNTRGSFTREYVRWWAQDAGRYFDEYLSDRLSNDVARAGNLSKIVSSTSTAKAFSISTGSRNAAFKRAEAQARADMNKNQRSYIMASLERMNNVGRL